MSKGQSLVIQFVVFFLIGFTLFVMVGGVFKYQSDMFRDRNIESNLNLTSSYLSSMVISVVDGCKKCDFVNMTTKIQNTTAGYILEYEITNTSGLNVSVSNTGKYSNSSIHNLLFSLSLFSGRGSSVEPISLTFDKTQNKLEAK